MDKINFGLLKTEKIGYEMDGLALVCTAAIRQTKTNKPYLAAQLSDGNEKISVNVWDWASQNVPQPNDVVMIEGKVSEYQGNKQLNISKFLKTNESPNMFAPTGDFNIASYKDRFRELTMSIPDKFIRDLTLDLFYGNEELWDVIPGAVGVHHDYIAGTLHHSVDVCNNALALYANYSHVADLSLVIAGALLHDVGKLFTYRLNGAVIEMTNDGQIFDHIIMGVQMLKASCEPKSDADYNKLALLQHIIASHHGKLEYGSPVTPKCIEAIIVNYADGMDAKARTYIDADKKASGDWTDKVYFIDNRPMVTSHRIKEMMSNE